MNVASLELCKTLWEISGWSNTDLYWRLHKPSGRSKLYTIQEMDYDNFQFRGDTEPNRRFREENIFFNAYDIGYLLRKLPAIIPSNKPGVHFYLLKRNKHWRAGYWKTDFSLKANTPEDGAAKLAIELFKAGVLKRDRATSHGLEVIGNRYEHPELLNGELPQGAFHGPGGILDTAALSPQKRTRPQKGSDAKPNKEVGA